jgi:hypothetical protein
MSTAKGGAAMSAKAKYTTTPAHLVRSLCGVENWLKGIRKVLVQMDPDQEIVLKSHLPDFATESDNMPLMKGCPPPEIYEDEEGCPRVMKGCEPPPWYQEDCP